MCVYIAYTDSQKYVSITAADLAFGFNTKTRWITLSISNGEHVLRNSLMIVYKHYTFWTLRSITADLAFGFNNRNKMHHFVNCYWWALSKKLILSSGSIFNHIHGAKDVFLCFKRSTFICLQSTLSTDVLLINGFFRWVNCLEYELTTFGGSVLRILRKSVGP